MAGDPDLKAKCQQLTALIQEIQSSLAWMPDMDPLDVGMLHDALKSVTSLQTMISQCLQSYPLPSRIAPEDDCRDTRRATLSTAGLTNESQSSPGGTSSQLQATNLVSPPFTPTVHHSAHDVVYCANRGAMPVQPAVRLPEKPRHYSDLFGGVDPLRPEDEDHGLCQQVLDLFAEQRALVKTLKNDSCDQILAKLKDTVTDGSTFRTSTSLLPPNGRNMRVFGSERQYSAGLVWDRTAMDLAKAWAWPSGYYAKTEFNIDSGSGRLKNGREEALVSLEDLLAANLSFTTVHAFNEIYADVNCATLVGLFARSLRYDHLLHALGLQTTLHCIMGRWLPVFVLDACDGVQALCRRHQRLLIAEYLAEVNPNADAILVRPFLPIAVTCFTELPHEDVMKFHGAYGVTEGCLDLVFGERDPHTLMRWAMVGLCYAVHARNTVAAQLLVTRAAPLVLKHRDALELSQVAPIAQAETSEPLIPLIGTFVVLVSITSGVMLGRLREALATLQQWLEQSDSLSFRMASWRSMKNHPDSKMMPFVGNQAITNRTKFHRALQRLASRDTPLAYLIELSVIVSGLHHPCLRLDLLQYILGLDTRYTAPLLRETIDLALRCAVSAN